MKPAPSLRRLKRERDTSDLLDDYKSTKRYFSESMARSVDKIGIEKESPDIDPDMSNSGDKNEKKRKELPSWMSGRRIVKRVKVNPKIVAKTKSIDEMEIEPLLPKKEVEHNTGESAELRGEMEKQRGRLYLDDVLNRSIPSVAVSSIIKQYPKILDPLPKQIAADILQGNSNGEEMAIIMYESATEVLSRPLLRKMTPKVQMEEAQIPKATNPPPSYDKLELDVAIINPDPISLQKRVENSAEDVEWEPMDF